MKFTSFLSSLVALMLLSTRVIADVEDACENLRMQISANSPPVPVQRVRLKDLSGRYLEELEIQDIHAAQDGFRYVTPGDSRYHHNSVLSPLAPSEIRPSMVASGFYDYREKSSWEYWVQALYFERRSRDVYCTNPTESLIESLASAAAFGGEFWTPGEEAINAHHDPIENVIFLVQRQRGDRAFGDYKGILLKKLPQGVAFYLAFSDSRDDLEDALFFTYLLNIETTTLQ